MKTLTSLEKRGGTTTNPRAENNAGISKKNLPFLGKDLLE